MKELTRIKPKEVMNKGKNLIKLKRIEEIQSCSNCPYKYDCLIIKNKVSELKVLGIEKYKNEIHNGEYYPNDYGWVMEYERKINNFVEEFVCHNLKDKCVYELREIDSVINEIKKTYDLQDPKIALLVRELTKLLIQIYRIDISISMEGVNKKVISDLGEITLVNPLLKERQNYSRLLMEALGKLETLTHGEKLNIDISINSVLKKLDAITNDQINVIDAEEVRNDY